VLRKRPSKKPADRAGSGARVLNLSAPHDPAAAEGAPAASPGPIDPLQAFETLGEALKAVREARGLSVQEVADVTRVRRAYLEAIEATQLDLLPSRPFTIGYIRAYASALGVDPDAAVERFKTDEPVLEETLRAPVGMIDEKDPRVAAFLIGAMVIVAAIVLWNVAQRAMSANAPPPPLAPEALADKALRQMKPGVMELGAPLPAPVESTTPPPYETPGLAEAMGLKTDPTAAKPKTPNEGPAVNLASLRPTFQPLGKVYDSGNAQLSSVVTVQALKPAALIMRGADGSVYFARQLSKGDAFRVPQIAGLTLDVSNANDFQVFVYGQSKGVLPAAQVLAAKLATAPPAATPAVAAPAAATAAPKLALPPAAKPPAPKTPPAKVAPKAPG
jgi:cytoskeletal protein RodZ